MITQISTKGLIQCKVTDFSGFCKWLKRIIVIDHHFKGPFQEIDYNYYPHKDNDEGKTPVTYINVDSIIQQPLDKTILDTGTHPVQGIAWTGAGTIKEDEVSTDGGES